MSSAVLGWLWYGSGSKRQRSSGAVSRRAERRPRQHLEMLEPRVLLAADMGVLSAGLSGYLNGVETALESKVFNSSTDLPLVGDNLADLGDDFLQQVSSGSLPR